MDKKIIQYLWDTGVYDRYKMIELVDNQKISKQEFFEITRLSYQGIKKG